MPGGANELVLPPRMRKAVMEGITQAAQAGAWLISGGMDTGMGRSAMVRSVGFYFSTIRIFLPYDH